MKKFFLVTIATFFLATAVYAYTTLEARALLAVAALEDAGYTFKTSKSGYLSSGHYSYRSTYLYSGVNYAIVGVGDSIRDLDTVLYDENWNVVASDKRSHDTSQVLISPKWDGKFYIKTKAYGGSGNYAQVIGWQ